MPCFLDSCRIEPERIDLKSSSQGPWIAVQVYTGFEYNVGATLRQHGYEEFVPSFSTQNPRRGRARGRPLFPGYVFCRYIEWPRFKIIQASKVIRLVGFKEKVTPIPADELHKIRRICDSGVDVQPFSFVSVGERVMITCGPLVGLEGIVITSNNGRRLVVSVELLQRSIVVHVNMTDVRAIAGQTIVG